MSDLVFGPTVTPRDVEKAIEATLKKWQSTYLRFIERKLGLPKYAYPNVASWRSADTMEERFPEQQIPAVQVMCTTNTELYSEAGGAVGHFDGEVDVLVQSGEPEAARENAGYYAFVLGLILAQNQGLDGTLAVAGFKWGRIGVPAVGKPDARWLALGSIEVNLAVENVFNPLGGPTEPTDDVPPDNPLVEQTVVILGPETPGAQGAEGYPDTDVFPDTDVYPGG